MSKFGVIFIHCVKVQKSFAFVLLMEKRGKKENASVQKLYTTFYVSS